jgi:hypothetical protein
MALTSGTFEVGHLERDFPLRRELRLSDISFEKLPEAIFRVCI